MPCSAGEEPDAPVAVCTAFEAIHSQSLRPRRASATGDERTSVLPPEGGVLTACNRPPSPALFLIRMQDAACLSSQRS